MSLLVIDPGLASRVVDHGRPKSRHLGVPPGGAADRAAFDLANAMVGNKASCPGLEIAVKGPILRAFDDVGVALVGAAFVVSRGRETLSSNGTINLRAGEELHIGGAPRGLRGYLCVPGGFRSAKILDSRSGLTTLHAGDVLACQSKFLPERRLHFDCPFLVTPEAWSLRVLPGPQVEWFQNAEFYTQTFIVTPAGNRMGLRLEGLPLTMSRREMISEPVCPGSVQITREGQGIILGVDGQTIGGYPQIAIVIRADLDCPGQMRPGDRVRFALVDRDAAAHAWTERETLLREWRTRIGISLDEH